MKTSVRRLPAYGPALALREQRTLVAVGPAAVRTARIAASCSPVFPQPASRSASAPRLAQLAQRIAESREQLLELPEAVRLGRPDELPLDAPLAQPQQS